MKDSPRPEDSPARDTARSISTPTAATGRCLILKESGFVTISEKQTPKNCRTLNFSAEDFPARLFQLLETGEDSRTQEVSCSLKLSGWLRQKDLRICCLKMYLMY